MSTTIQLIDALKRELKAKGVTYAELAQRLGISEASVKRTFALRHFSLERLERVLAAVGMDFMELAQAATDAPHLITQLTLAQEQEIIGDKRLLVVAVAALNLIPLEHIVATYRLLVARTFSWIPNGPIQTYFRAEAFSDFLDSEFNGQQELLQLVSVMLSPSSTRALLDRLRQVADEFSQQHQDDARLPYDQRHSLTFLLAARPWMPQAFQGLMR
jgi:transcriptional regulator with XRE-family HTH domain